MKLDHERAAPPTTRVVTGIKPSGTPHLGNYLAMLRPSLELAQSHEAFVFLADGHALTTVTDPDELRRLTLEAAATLLALGLDPDRTVLYRQSDVPEVFELAWLLACSAPKGLLNRAHAYKAVVDDNVEAGRPPDDGVSTGLFTYPVLMAADILLFDGRLVPVGRDQKQHVEVARDIAESFNRTYGEVLKLPEPLIDERVAVIPGMDGRKMSKSYANVIPIFGPPDQLRRLVARIVTDSRRPEEPKDPATCTVFGLYALVASTEDVEAMRTRYTAGGIGYAEVKDRLATVLEDALSEPRRRYEELIADPAQLDGVLRAGAAVARPIARGVLDRVREAVGIGAQTGGGGSGIPVSPT